MAKKPENMSVEELEAELQALDVQKQDIRAKQLELHKLLDLKIMDAEAERLIAGMDESERAALNRTLAVQGIDSAEKVGQIGNS